MQSRNLRTWSSSDDQDLLTYDDDRMLFNVKAGRINAATAAELIVALKEAMEHHGKNMSKSNQKTED